MKNSGVADQFGIYFVFGEHHICAWIAVEGEITVSIWICMYKSKSGMDFIVHNKVSGIDTAFFNSCFQLFAEHIVSNFSDKCCFFAKAIQHGEYIAGSAARVCFKSRISLGTVAVFSKVDQKFAESGYIIQFVFH